MEEVIIPIKDNKVQVFVDALTALKANDLAKDMAIANIQTTADDATTLAENALQSVQTDGQTGGQTGGVIVFATFAELDAYTPINTDEEKTSYKVTNDANTALNGYYHWVSGTAYTKDADLANGVVESGNVDAVTGGTVFTAIDSTVKSNSQTNLDRFSVVSDNGLFKESQSLLYTKSGTPKDQSTLYAGYVTAITMASVGSFDKADMHIQLDAPTVCRVAVLDASLNDILFVNVDCVDGWNEISLPRLITADDDSTIYIGIETINRDFMTINTITAPAAYASTGTYPVKGTLIGNGLGEFTNTVSSQLKIPFRMWNSHALSVSQQSNVEFQATRVTPILVESLTTAMADTKGGSLEDTFANYISTVAGYATAYLTPDEEFDSIRTVIRNETACVLRLYLKTDALGDVEFVDTELLPAGDHFIVIALSKFYTSADLGTQFYIAVESVNHVSRLAVRNFSDDEGVFPQPVNTHPAKTIAQASPDNDGWLGGGSSIAHRLYVEFFKLSNMSNALALAVSNAESTAITEMAIPSNFYAIDGLNDQSIYYSNITKAPSSDEYLFDIGAGLTGRMKAKSWQNRKTGAGSSTIASKLYNRSKVLLDTKSSTLTSVLTSAGTGKTPVALCIGDSITARGFYTQDLLDLASTDVMELDLIGTVGVAPNEHEGYGGKTVDWFYTDAASPFVFGGVFDFPQYMSTNVFAAVDYIFMHLGVNDIFQATDDTNAVSISDAASVQIEAMIASFKLFNPSIKFGLMLPITPSFDQDAWGIVYSDAATYWRYNSSRGEWCNTMIANFDNRLGEEIYVLPTNCTIDIEAGYNVADPLHPIDAGQGYQDMANTLWSFMKVKEL